MGITAKKEEKKHLLSHEETLDLIQKVQNGDEEAKALLISSNLGLDQKCNRKIFKYRIRKR